MCLNFSVGLSFVGAIYAMMMAVCTVLVLVQQMFLISKGVTGTEWRRGDTNNRRNFLWNWKTFLCCYR